MCSADPHPLCQLRVGLKPFGGHPEPSVHRTAAHYRRLGANWHRLLRVGADEYAALSAGGDGHVPVHQERQSTEHLLLGQGLLFGQ